MIKIIWLRRRIIHPAPQSFTAVYGVDGQTVAGVFVGEVTPDGIIGLQIPQGFQKQRYQSIRSEQAGLVTGPVRMNLEPAAKLILVFVKSRLKPAWSNQTAPHPVWRKPSHFAEYLGNIDIRGARHFQRPCGSAAFRQGGALQQHGTGVATRCIQRGDIRAGIDPGALAQWPAITGRGARVITITGDHMEIQVEILLRHIPERRFSQGETVAHGQIANADEAFKSVKQSAALDFTPGRIGPVQHPQGLAGAGAVFQQIAYSRQKSVDSAAHILNIHQQYIEGIKHGRGGPAHFAVQAEYRYVMAPIPVVGCFHHVVLLVAAHAVLGTERRCHVQACIGQGIQAVAEIRRHRGRVRQQGHSPTVQRSPEWHIEKDFVNTCQHIYPC